MEKTLSELSKKYPTDKDFTHNYYNMVYESVFSKVKNEVRNICEIGVGNSFDWGDMKIRPANSLKVWRDYFPNAQVLGLDIVNYPEIEDMDRIKIDWIDQSKKELIEEYSEKLNNYDIILDDGSHNVYDQTITFYHFFKSLKKGGIYVIEDLHSSIEVNDPEKNKIWGWGTPGYITPLEMLENYEITSKIINDYLTAEEIKYLEENIESVKVYRIHPTSITSIIYKK